MRAEEKAKTSQKLPLLLHIGGGRKEEEEEVEKTLSRELSGFYTFSSQ